MRSDAVIKRALEWRPSVARRSDPAKVLFWLSESVAERTALDIIGAIDLSGATLPVHDRKGQT